MKFWHWIDLVVASLCITPTLSQATTISIGLTYCPPPSGPSSPEPTTGPYAPYFLFVAESLGDPLEYIDTEGHLNDITQAASYTFTDLGQLRSGVGFVSVNISTILQAFSATPSVGELSTFFSVESGLLRWSNSVFNGTEASFCRTNDTVFISQNGTLPNDCRPVLIGAVLISSFFQLTDATTTATVMSSSTQDFIATTSSSFTTSVSTVSVPSLSTSTAPFPSTILLSSMVTSTNTLMTNTTTTPVLSSATTSSVTSSDSSSTSTSLLTAAVVTTTTTTTTTPMFTSSSDGSTTDLVTGSSTDITSSTFGSTSSGTTSSTIPVISDVISFSSATAGTTTAQSTTTVPTTTSTTTIVTTITTTVCQVPPLSSSLCPDQDRDTVAFSVNGTCYGVLCSTSLAGTVLIANSTTTQNFRACAGTCDVYNAAVPYGCAGVNYLGSSVVAGQNNCLLYGVVTAENAAASGIDSVRLIDDAFPVVE